MLSYVVQRSRLLWDTWVFPENQWEIVPISTCAFIWMTASIYRSAKIAYHISAAVEGMSRIQEARILSKRALQIEESYLPKDHLNLATNLSHLGLIEHHLGNGIEAKNLMQRAIIIREQSLPPDNIDTANLYSLMSEIEMGLGNRQTARDLTLKCLAIEEKHLSPDDPTLAIRYSNLGTYEGILGDLIKAKEHCSKAIKIEELFLPMDHPRLAISYNNLALVEIELGNLKNAVELLRKSLKIRQHSLGQKNISTANGMASLSMALALSREYEESEQLANESLNIWSLSDIQNDWRQGKACFALGLIYKYKGHYCAAKEMFIKAKEFLCQVSGEENFTIKQIKSNLSEII